MKQSTFVFGMVGACMMGITGIFSLWWKEHAPYCCTHMCGQTISMAECWGSFVIPMLAMLSVILFGIASVSYIRSDSEE